ncbi:MAG: antibiotic biosynthesis monooxygenase [Candidatus Saccharibacteria bacterium]|nr:antibiotic biosynthesis monooxygenase [Candidatus Saccharibacteria bacterium]
MLSIKRDDCKLFVASLFASAVYNKYVTQLPRKKSAWPLTVVFSWEVQDGKEAAFREWIHGIAQAASRWPGHMGVTTLSPPNGKGPYHSVLRFDTEEHLLSWLHSTERNKWVSELEGIAVAHTSPKATGMESWFEVPGSSVKPPPKWKMVVVTFIAVYPLSLLLGEVVSPHTADWNILLRSLVFPLIAPAVLTYFFMPFFTQRVFRRWLYKSPGRTLDY